MVDDQYLSLDSATDIIGEGILPEGGQLMIDGESGVGKSLLRLELAIHLALGRPCWGLPINGPRRVALIQFETTLSQEGIRLRRMLQGLEVPEEAVHDRLSWSNPAIRIDLKRRDDRQRALEIVRASGADVVIYDPLSSIHTANENDNIEIRAVLDSLTWIARQTGSSTIVIHHFGKPSPDTPLAHRGRGTSSILDWCDTKISVTPRGNEQKILRVLTFVKIRNGPPRPDVLLERNRFFLHEVIDEGMLCTAGQVREVLPCATGGQGREIALRLAGNTPGGTGGIGDG